MMQVRFITREFRKTGFSIEGIFNVVRSFLEKKLHIEEYQFDPAKSRYQNIQAVKKLSPAINHITGDVYFLALGLKGNKNLMTIHDLGHYEHLKKHSLPRFFLYRYFWLYFPLKKIDIVTVVSEYTKQRLIQYFPFAKDKIRVVYNPVKPVFTFSKKEALHASPRILQIGTGPHKNLDNLIEAVKGSDYHLEIVAYPENSWIEKLEKYNIAHTISNSLSDEELYRKYVDCDVLFFASLHEGFGMPIIEAQAVGRPVITSNHGAMLEVGEGSAVLVDPNNVKQIRGELDKLIRSREHYDVVVERGIANAARYSASKIANDYLEVYKELDKHS